MLFIHTRYTLVHVNVPPQKPDEMKLLQIPFSIYLQADEIEHATSDTHRIKYPKPTG